MSFIIFDETPNSLTSSKERDEIWTRVIYREQGVCSREDLIDIITLPQTRTLFYEYLKERFCEENLEFYVEIERLRVNLIEYQANKQAKEDQKAKKGTNNNNNNNNIEQKSREKRANSNGLLIQRQLLQILTRYLADNAIKPVNIDYYSRKSLVENLEGHQPNLLLDSLVKVKEEIAILLYNELYIKFRASQELTQFLQTRRSILELHKSSDSSPSVLFLFNLFI